MKIGFIGSNYYGYEAFCRLLKHPDVEPAFVIGLNEERFAKSGMSRFYYQGSRYAAHGLGLGIDSWIVDDLNRSEASRRLIADRKPDYVFAMGWPDILEPGVLSLAKGFLGVHPSWLPLYRGGAPLNWQLIDGCDEIGVTVFFFSPRVDAGRALLQKSYSVGDRNVQSFIDDIYIPATTEVLTEAVSRLKDGEAGFSIDTDKGFYRPRRKPDDGLIDFHLTAVQVARFVRAQCLPFPNAFFNFQEKLVRVVDARVVSGQGVPGTVLAADMTSVTVACREGAVLLRGCLDANGNSLLDWFQVNRS